MRFEKFISTLGPAIAMAVAAGAARQSGGRFRMQGMEGVRLEDLDLDDEAPRSVKLFSADTVRIVEGDAFAITVEGDEDAKDRMRFLLSEGRLAILRGEDDWGSDGHAVVNVMMPAPRKLMLAGSGSIHSATLADEAKVSVAGSGDLTLTGVEAERLTVSIAGSGSLSAEGTVKRLELSIAGSGDAALDHLRVDRAEVQIAGSGSAAFHCDGKVDARLMGSGNVTVRGSARCRVKSIGSGSLICEREESVTVEGEEA